MSQSTVNSAVDSVSTFKPYRLKPNPFESFRDPQTGKWRIVFNLPGGNPNDKATTQQNMANSLLAQTLPVKAVQEMHC